MQILLALEFAAIFCKLKEGLTLDLSIISRFDKMNFPLNREICPPESQSFSVFKRHWHSKGSPCQKLVLKTISKALQKFQDSILEIMQFTHLTWGKSNMAAPISSFVGEKSHFIWVVRIIFKDLFSVCEWF